MRRKFEYHYFIDGIETTEKNFKNRLQWVCLKCDTNFDNPLLNISYVDEKKFNSYMRKFKTGRDMILITDDGSLRVVRKEIQ